MKHKSNHDSQYSLSGSQYLSELSYNRLIVLGSIFIIAFFVVAIKLLSLVLYGDFDKALNFIDDNSFYMHRKEITDRNGEILAVNLATASLYARPKNIFEPKQVAKKLVKIFPDLSYKELLANFTGKKQFVWIKRNITPKEQYAVNSLGVPGLSFEKGEKRVYLHGNILSHILGYVDVDGKGISGIESQFDKLLSSDPLKLKTDNSPLILSIDIRVQNIVYNILRKAARQYQVDSAVAVVMDANSGEVYSMVSLPDFDPHSPNLASKDSLFNRASHGVYELGSVFKAISFAMALDAKATSLNQVYYVKNPIKADKFKISDYSKKTNWMSVPEIFMYSSNIGTARISLDLGVEAQKKYLELFGVTKKNTIEIPERGTPILPSNKAWSEIHTMTISYGHGIAITPLHMAQSFSTVVNGGYAYPTTILKGANDNLDKVEQVISNEASKKMRKLLRLVVDKGTGRLSNVPGYRVGGKTGSADKAVKGGYSENAKISSYVAAFPMHDPKFVVMLMLDSPKGFAKNLTTAGRAVAPIAKDIISKIGPILKVVPVDDNDEKVNEKLWVDYKTDSEILDSF